MSSSPITNETQPVHSIVQTMANLINYLNVSLYESQFVHNHEQARLTLNVIYDYVSLTPSECPSYDYIIEFYNSVICLRNVTDTYDPDYHKYMRELKKEINIKKPVEITKIE